MIVVDTPVVAQLFLGGERNDEARALFREDPVWVVPLCWRSDFREVLAVGLQRGGLVLEDALELMGQAETLFAGNEYRVDSASVLSLVVGSSFPARECEMVALARSLEIPLVTLNDDLRTAFPGTVRLLHETLATTDG